MVEPEVQPYIKDVLINQKRLSCTLKSEMLLWFDRQDGNSPLMLAVMDNHADVTELLLKEGADVNVKNQEQRLERCTLMD